MNMNFHSHFSDTSAHNEATTFENMENFIHWMYYNKFFHKGWYNL